MTTRPNRVLPFRGLFRILSTKEIVDVTNWVQQLADEASTASKEVKDNSDDIPHSLPQRFLAYRGPYCQHETSCVNNTLRGLLKGVLSGYSITVLLDLIPLILRGAAFREPHRVARALFGGDTLRFTAFLGAFVGIFRGVLCSARRMRGEEGPVNSLIAGSCAGLALALDTRPRRLAFSLYALTRAMHLLFTEACERGLIPSIPHGDTLLMAVANIQVAWAFMMSPNSLSDSYHKFLVHQSGRPLSIVRCVEAGACGRKFERILLEKHLLRDTNYTWESFLALPRAQQVCLATHHYTDSCLRFFLDFFPAALGRAFNLYLPLNLVGMIALRSAQLFRDPVTTLGKAALSTLRSSLFLGSYCTSALLVPCFGRHVTGKPHRWFYTVNGFIAGCMVLLEPKSRRIEVALYCFPRALESFAKTLAQWGWLPGSRIIEVPVFMFAIGIVMAVFHIGTETQQGIVMKLLAYLLGKN